MDLKGFIRTWKGQLVRGGQCVGLYRQYIVDVWKIAAGLEGLGATGGAEGLFTRFHSDVGPRTRQFCELIEFRPGMVPQAGDVVVFRSTPTNRFGHVAIFVEPGKQPNTMEVFEQNGFRLDGAKMATWNYDRVMGWLRLRAA